MGTRNIALRKRLPGLPSDWPAPDRTHPPPLSPPTALHVSTAHPTNVHLLNVCRRLIDVFYFVQASCCCCCCRMACNVMRNTWRSELRTVMNRRKYTAVLRMHANGRNDRYPGHIIRRQEQRDNPDKADTW